jgi:hypothetical protein
MYIDSCLDCAFCRKMCSGPMELIGKRWMCSCFHEHPDYQTQLWKRKSNAILYLGECYVDLYIQLCSFYYERRHIVGNSSNY